MTINGFKLSDSDLAFLTGDAAPEKVYMIDERDEMYRTPEDAMLAAERESADWTGDLYVVEYSNNVITDGDGYALRDLAESPLIATGIYWEYSSGKWINE